MTIKGEDFLSVDTPIPGQNFVCLSFVSPEKILKNKESYFVHEFLKSKAEEYNLSQEKMLFSFSKLIVYKNMRIIDMILIQTINL